MKYIYLNALFLMFVFHTSCGGQNQTNPPQDNFSKEHNGISESQLKELATSKVPMGQVRNVKQDRNGNILIAAGWGGVRYDGKSFTNLTSKLGSHRFWDVLEDRRGNIWFASYDSGVYYYNGKSLPTGQAGFQHFTTREGLANNAVMCIYEDKAGIIWFGTGGGGVSRYDGKSFRNFTTKDGLSNNDLTTIMEDKTGKLWFGTRGEPCFYDGKTFTILKNKDGKAFKNVWSIIEDKKGSIWFGDVDGLWRYDGSVITKVSQRGAYAIIEDKKGNIWTTGSITPYDGSVWALSRYDAKSLYNKKPTVTEIKSGGPAFLGLLEANDGSIWFGSAGAVHRYDGKTFTDFKSKEGQK
ncbi:ligand-binding sensor domain-containing protein [Terrimonas alba]|uniref:ligand-binding sensor domain-containing protein n=1 Tax=Terrimonas alba TaxID=3349636 RepID=UPI0035F3A6B7